MCYVVEVVLSFYEKWDIHHRWWICSHSTHRKRYRGQEMAQSRRPVRIDRCHGVIAGCFCDQYCGLGRISGSRSEEHTSELQSRGHLVCRLLLEKKKEE